MHSRQCHGKTQDRLSMFCVIGHASQSHRRRKLVCFSTKLPFQSARKWCMRNSRARSVLRGRLRLSHFEQSVNFLSLNFLTSLGMIRSRDRGFLVPGSTGCQPVHLGTLPRCLAQFGPLHCDCCRQAAGQLQASSLCSPEPELRWPCGAADDFHRAADFR